MPFRLGDLVPEGTFPEPTRAQRGCYGKERHDSEGAAQSAVRASLRRDETCREGERLQTYRCRRCLGWHVGHGRVK